jgi:uncharacterized membrane protein
MTVVLCGVVFVFCMLGLFMMFQPHLSFLGMLLSHSFIGLLFSVALTDITGKPAFPLLCLVVGWVISVVFSVPSMSKLANQSEHIEFATSGDKKKFTFFAISYIAFIGSLLALVGVLSSKIQIPLLQNGLFGASFVSLVSLVISSFHLRSIQTHFKSSHRKQQNYLPKKPFWLPLQVWNEKVTWDDEENKKQ